MNAYVHNFMIPIDFDQVNRWHSNYSVCPLKNFVLLVWNGKFIYLNHFDLVSGNTSLSEKKLVN